MAGGKETGRQKMIGMMYLFLTALLALNVSKEIINAFVVINKGIEETNSNFSSKLSSQYGIFKAELEKNRTKVEPWYNKAEEIRKESAKVMAYLMEIKGRIVATSSDGDQEQWKKYVGKDKNGQDTLVDLMNFDKKDDYDSPTNLLIGSEPATPSTGPHSAVEMVQTIQKFRDVVKKACSDDPGLVKRFDDAFAFKKEVNHDGKEEPWGVLNFYHSPVVASVAVISKLQTDVKNAESDAIEYLLTRIDASALKFTKVVPVVRVKSSLIAVGDSLVAEIAMGAIDETKSPTITVNGQPVPVKGGVGYLSRIQTAGGDQDWKGTITYEGPMGTQSLPFNIPFKVAMSTDAVVDPTAMNVLYPGLENPISVSVPGADSDKLNLTCNNGQIKINKLKGGQYTLVPQGAFPPKSEIEVSVSGETSTGGKRNFGVKKFRIKPLPKPEPLLAGKGPSDGDISIGALKEATKMTAVLRDFVFEGVKYEITGFTLIVPAAGGDIPFYSTSGEITAQMKDQISKMRAKQRVTFNEIKAVGPDKVVKLLPPLSFKLK
ncbi:MAG: GldM family protein [Bacteroidota bacterium]